MVREVNLKCGNYLELLAREKIYLWRVVCIKGIQIFLERRCEGCGGGGA